MLRLQGLRANRAQRDPRRAFSRLRGNLAALRAARDAARQNLLDGLGAERRTAALRTAYDSFKEHGLRAVSSATNSARTAQEPAVSSSIAAGDERGCPPEAACSSPEQIEREVAAVSGQHGIVRVRCILPHHASTIYFSLHIIRSCSPVMQANHPSAMHAHTFICRAG